MRSSFVSKLGLLLGLMLMVPILAEAQAPTWRQNLEAALSGETAGRVLAFEHKSSTWHGLAWDGTSSLSTLDEDVFDIGFDGKAELQVGGDEETLYVYLVDTNPLLYTLDPTEATEEDSENAASLNQFVELLSTVLQKRATAAEGPFTIHGIQPLTPPPSLPSSCEEEFNELEDAVRSLKNLAEKVELDESRIVAFLQSVELDQAPGTFPDPLTKITEVEIRDKAILEARAALTSKKGCAEAAADLLKDVEKIQKAKGVLAKTVARHQVLKMKLDEAGGNLVNGVVAYRRPEGTVAKVKSGKVRTEGFTVKIDPRFKDLIVPDHPVDVKAEYELHHEIRGIDFDFGLVYTDLAVAEFGAVSSAVDDTPGCEGVDDCKIIDQTGEDTRSGNVALFATWRLDNENDSDRHFGPQIGVGIDTDEPALFAGFGIGLSKSVKISVGYTWQEVTVLDEQSIGDVVASGDDIKTESDWDDSWYVALSITLNDLSFFAPDDDE